MFGIVIYKQRQKNGKTLVFITRNKATERDYPFEPSLWVLNNLIASWWTK